MLRYALPPVVSLIGLVVIVAAVIYFLRALVGTKIPLNSGCLRPVEIRIPEPSLLAPGPARAVAGGNVETSQRIVDVLLGFPYLIFAIGLMGMMGPGIENIILALVYKEWTISCRVIRGEEPPRISGADAMRTLAVVEAVHQAARSGTAIGL